MTQCIADPLSRNQIRQTAGLIRQMDGSQDSLFFNIVRFLEVKLPSIDPSFNFRVMPKEEMGECHGITYPDRNEIQIRQDVYERAIDGSGRDRLTLAHELGHLILHEKENISYARMEDGADLPRYRNPEWQADAFGGELLMPHDLIKGLDADAIKDSCKVSRKAALCQMSK